MEKGRNGKISNGEERPGVWAEQGSGGTPQCWGLTHALAPSPAGGDSGGHSCSYPWSAGGGSLCRCSCCCPQLVTHDFCFRVFPFCLQFLSFLFSPSLKQYRSPSTSSQCLSYLQGFVHSSTTPSLRPSSPPLLRMRLSPLQSLGSNRSLSKSTRDIYILPLVFCARCHSGLRTAGKQSPWLLVCDQDGIDGQMSSLEWVLLPGCERKLVFSPKSSHTDRSWNYLQG